VRASLVLKNLLVIEQQVAVNIQTTQTDTCHNTLPASSAKDNRPHRQTVGFSINQPGDLTFDLLTSNLVHVIDRGVGKLLTNFGVSGTFRSQLMGQHLSDGPSELVTLTFDLGGQCTCR